MKRCEKCGVWVHGDLKRCPLCQSELTGESDGQNLYPNIPTVYKQFEFFFKLLILGTVSGAIICVVLNIILSPEHFWALYVVLGVACFWIFLILAGKKKDNIPIFITNQVILISALSIIWDFITGWNNWSIDFVVPLSCTVAIISLSVLSKVLKLPTEEYLICSISVMTFGLAPLILFLTGALTTIIPTMVCIALSLIYLTSLLLFEGKNMRLELQKRFHF